MKFANLRDLCDALNAFVPSRDNERLEDVIDLCNLPTFGGDAPADTTGIWSWDADSILVYCDTYRITAREQV